ncbi:hypothetical protein B0T16DRAFT_422929 [Cercophora newfieldiana]|uniref:Phytocyanin domain-containing protein n=1 Tax=Cercophora newfieldiana TaxID=92897 RepID=A0AA39XSA7_9PEZI|nr:hypothetical protein B0T16DRAFT_422929 [Cercophora newfieldiana]
MLRLLDAPVCDRHAPIKVAQSWLPFKNRPCFPSLFSLPSLFSSLPSLCVCSLISVRRSFFIFNLHFSRAGTRQGIQILFIRPSLFLSNTPVYSISNSPAIITKTEEKKDKIIKMKYSTTLALGVAHLALGKSVQKVAPREPQVGGRVSVNGVAASQVEIAELQRLFGFGAGNGVNINVLWVNVGGGAATTVLNQPQTVTVTQTVAGAAGTVAAGVPPVAGAPGEVAATPTDVAAANPVVGATGATHSVTVGGPQGLAFNPPQLVAAPGDSVVFTFLSQNHTVTQSAFETPCDPLAGGMDSGFQSNPNNTVNPPPQVAMQVMVNTPLWFYCRQNNHCGKGMTFSINPTADKTHAMFQALAIQQRGNGGGSAITGGQAAAPPAGAPPAAAPPAGSPPAAVAPGANLPAGVVTGAGTVAADGTCVCAVSCQFDNSQFPVAAQGAGAFGGVGGSVPMAIPAARRF